MAQMLLFPDPRPLVERLGPQFFRNIPELPGVYLMRDRAETVLYVGKAKNLRRRLASYRVANPDRMPRRHLRLLRAVEQIELVPCADEAAALVRESALLRTLRPRFNRAGTWPAAPRYLAWRISSRGLELAIAQMAEPGWCYCGPMGSSAVYLHATLARLTWCAVFPEKGVAGLPEGWFRGRHRQTCFVPLGDSTTANIRAAVDGLTQLSAGCPDAFKQWVLQRTAAWIHPFDLALREADLETLEFLKS